MNQSTVMFIFCDHDVNLQLIIIADCNSQEEEEKESLAWKVLPEEQTQSLKELTVHELEV